jgi:O-methyltransferase involved in polyketide biosynthesis
VFENVPSRTAEAVCLMRAFEHARPNGPHVVDDPYAHWFLRPLARAAIAYEGAGPDLGRYADWATDGLLQFVLARHRYMDDALARALRGQVEQIVLLGAGYDMRAYRFAKALRKRPLFEVLGEPVTFGLHPEDAGPFFERLGFRLQDVADASVLRQRYFTPTTHIYPTNYVVCAVTRPGRLPRR